MLFGAAVMIALMADGDDDAGLIVVPAMGGDPGALAQLRARAVGGHQQTRLDDFAVGERDVDAVGARIEGRDRGGAQIDAFGLGARGQRIDQMAIFDHMGEGLAGFDIAGKGQEYRPGRVFQLGIGDDHVEDRLRAGCDLVPDAERLEQPPAGGDDGGRARIAARPHSERRIGHDDGNVSAKPLTQRQRQRQAGKCAAADDNASLCRHAIRLLILLLPDYSWAKQVHETRLASRHSGAMRSIEPGISRFRVHAKTLPRNDPKPKALPCPMA